MAMGMHLTSMFLLCVLTSVSSVEVERNDTAILSGDMENKVGVGTTNYVATDVTSGPNRFRLRSIVFLYKNQDFEIWETNF